MAIRNVAAVGIRVRPDTTSTGSELKKKLRGMEKDNRLDIPVRSGLEKRNEKTEFTRQLKTDLQVIQERLDKGAAPLKAKLIPAKARETMEIIRESVKRTNEAIDKQGIAFRVPVKADPKAIKASIKAAVKEAEKMLADEDSIIIGVTLNVRDLKREWENLKRDLNGDSVDIKAELDRKKAVQAQLAALTRHRWINMSVRITESSLAQARTTLAALSGLGLITDTGRGLRNFIDNIDTYALRLSKIGLLTGQITAGVLGLTSSLHALGAGLTSLGAFALTAPAVFGAAAAFIAIQVAAFKNFKDAIGGDLDALGALPEKAQAAARSLTGTWSSIQQPVQIAYWERMGTVVQQFVQDVLPELRDGMTLVASEAGAMTQQALRSFTQLSGKQVFAGMFRDLNDGAALATQGVRPFVGALIELGRVGSSYLPTMGKYLKDAADTFAAWVKRSSDAGKITMWIDNARVAAHNLGQSFRSLTGIFGAIVDTTGTGGQLQGLASGLENIRRLVAGPAFQDGMRNLFKGAYDTLQLVQSGVSNLGHGLSQLSPVLSSIMVTSGQVMYNLLTALGGVITRPAFQNGLLNFFGGISEGISGFLDALPKMTDALGNLGSLVGTVFANVFPVVGEMLEIVADTFNALQPSVQNLVPALSNLMSNGFQMLAVVLPLITGPLSLIIELFNALPSPVQFALATLVPLYLIMKKLAVLRFGGNYVSPLQAFALSSANAATGIKRAFAGVRDDVAAFRNFGRAFGVNTLPQQMGAVARGMSSAFSSAFGAIRAGASNLFRFMGGGAGLAFAAILGGISSLTEDSRKLEQIAENTQAAYKGIADAAFASGQQVKDSVEAQKAALTEVSKLLSVGKADGWASGIASTVTGKESSTALEMIKKAGFTENEVAAYMTGQGGAAAGAYMKSLRDSMREKEGSGIFRNFLTDSSGALRANKQGADALDGVINAKLEAQKELDAKLELFAFRAEFAQNAIANTLNETGGISPVTLDNVTLLKKALSGDSIDTEWVKNAAGNYEDISAASEAWKSYGTQFASAMGGGEDMMVANEKTIYSTLRKIQGNLDSTGQSMTKLGQNDYVRPLINDLVNAGVPITQVKRGLEGMGFSAEQAAEQIKFRFGEVVTNAGTNVRILGEEIAKVTSGSRGINEFSEALSAASGIDFDAVKRAASLDGLDPTKVLSNLGTQGIDFSSIKRAGEALGLSRSEIGAALRGIAEDVRNASASGVWNTASVIAYKGALDEVRDSAGDAAAQADILYAAIDKLRGGQRSAMQIQSDFQASLDGIDEFMKGLAGDDSNPAISLSSIFDLDALGNIDLATEKGRELSKALGEIGSKGLATAKDAFDRTLGSGGTIAQAMEASRLSVADIDKSLGALKEQLDPAEYAELLKTFGLLPEDIANQVLAASDVVGDGLADIVGLLQEIPAGKTIDLGVVDDDVKRALTEVGIQMETINGKTVITLSSDEAANAAQMQALRDMLINNNFQVPVEIAAPTGDDVVGVTQGIQNALNSTEFTAAIQRMEDMGLLSSVTEALRSGQGNGFSAWIGSAVDSGMGQAVQQALTSGGFSAWIQGVVDNGFTGDIRNKLLLQQYGINVNNANAQQALNTIQNALSITGFTFTPKPNTSIIGSSIQTALNGIGFVATLATINVGGAVSRAAAAISSSLSGIFSANGNLINAGGKVQKFANGGFSGSERHVAQIAKNTMRVWAEPETGGEAYIPLSPAKRERSLAILGEVADRFGYELLKQSADVRHYENGTGNSASAVVSSGGDTYNITNHFPQAEPTSVTVSKAGAQRARVGKLGG